MGIMVIIKKVKVQIYSLISSLNIYHPTIFTPGHWNCSFVCNFNSLRGTYSPAAIFGAFNLSYTLPSLSYQVSIHLSQMKHLMVKYVAQGHNIVTMSQD